MRIKQVFDNGNIECDIKQYENLSHAYSNSHNWFNQNHGRTTNTKDNYSSENLTNSENLNNIPNKNIIVFNNKTREFSDNSVNRVLDKIVQNTDQLINSETALVCNRQYKINSKNLLNSGRDQQTGNLEGLTESSLAHCGKFQG